MIDDKAARERVETMNKANFQNLLMALSVERYLFEIYSHDELTTAYSPETATLLVIYKDPRSNALKNVLEAVKRGARETPEAHPKIQNRIFFSGGLSVVAVRGGPVLED